jgi:hypothetical protein
MIQFQGMVALVEEEVPQEVVVDLEQEEVTVEDKVQVVMVCRVVAGHLIPGLINLIRPEPVLVMDK